MNICLLLTACISPNGMCETKLQDADVRKSQYVDALHYYLQNFHDKIIFVENSGDNISSLFENEIVDGHLEVLSFCGNSFSPTLGKGYGEAENIEYAFLHSKYINDYDYVVKITGRLELMNIKTLLFDHKLFCKKEVVVSFLCSNLLDSRIVIASNNFWRNTFLPNKDRINDSIGRYFEVVLYDVIDKRQWRPFFLSLPDFKGVSGTSGSAYSRNNLFSIDYWRKMKLNICEYLK